MSLNKVDGKKTTRFVVFSLLLVLSIVAATYVVFPLKETIGRSTQSVANSEWVSWNLGSLSFGEDHVEHNDKETTRSFPFEERQGAVKILDGDSLYMALTRFGENKLITSDGSTVFYLKSSIEAKEDKSGGDSSTEQGENEEGN